MAMDSDTFIRKQNLYIYICIYMYYNAEIYTDIFIGLCYIGKTMITNLWENLEQTIWRIMKCTHTLLTLNVIMYLFLLRAYVDTLYTYTFWCVPSRCHGFMWLPVQIVRKDTHETLKHC